jgi:hypothetical protein
MGHFSNTQTLDEGLRDLFISKKKSLAREERVEEIKELLRRLP